MSEKAIAYAVPVFFLLIGVELLVQRAQGDVKYRFADSITSLSCGVGQQVIGPFLKTASLWIYVVTYEHLRLATIPASSVVGWFALLFGVDLGYYTFHRAAHRVNLLWAGHVVHHQSEEYNLTTALRQAWFLKVAEGFFYLPLAVVGFAPGLLVGMITVNTLYQFWIHTRSIGRLGPLEHIFNTPSHHRVHHGINPKYIDRNYAGMFIFWDRLFGTFHPEEEEPVYGTVKPLASYNPVWANVHYFVDIWNVARHARRWRDKLAVWLMPPEWRPADLGGPVVIPEVSRATQVKHDPRARRWVVPYVAVQFALVGAATSGLLLAAGAIAPVPALVATGLVVMTLASWGALLETRAWAAPFEAARLVLLAGAALWYAVPIT
jgi:sterol desaturase/sphingolipid hydroxylase (fatty acid hydroxylase superfamily)